MTIHYRMMFQNKATQLQQFSSAATVGIAEAEKAITEFKKLMSYVYGALEPNLTGLSDVTVAKLEQRIPA